jgi:hypothetical protein
VWWQGSTIAWLHSDVVAWQSRGLVSGCKTRNENREEQTHAQKARLVQDRDQARANVTSTRKVGTITCASSISNIEVQIHHWKQSPMPVSGLRTTREKKAANCVQQLCSLFDEQPPNLRNVADEFYLNVCVGVNVYVYVYV